MTVAAMGELDACEVTRAVLLMLSGVDGARTRISKLAEEFWVNELRRQSTRLSMTLQFQPAPEADSTVNTDGTLSSTIKADSAELPELVTSMV